MAERYGQYGQNRFWEMILGILVWTTLIGAVASAIFYPLAAVVFIIIFDLYWVFRVFYFVILVFLAYSRYRRTTKIDWSKKLQEVDGWEEIYHVVMLPTYKEDVSIVRKAIQGIIDSGYPPEKFLVAVGGEEGDKEYFAEVEKQMRKEFDGVFDEFLFTVHPKGLPDEIPGKGSNLNWMGYKIKEIIDRKNIPYENIVVSAFDIDTIGHPEYFARLAYMFLTEPDPLRTSYQPLTLFSNNIWQATVPVRVASFGTTFWLLSMLVRPDKLWTFSSHSMSWQMLVDVGFWEKDIVSEDSRIFMQAFIHYDGDYRTQPMYLPVHMDAVEGESYFESLVALYKQQRRWSWGMEHLAYMYREFKKHPKIPLHRKIGFLFDGIEGRYTQSTAPLIIFFLGYTPFFFASQSSIALVANAPFTLERMMQFATVGMFVSGGMSFLFLPKRPKDFPWYRWLVMLVQWMVLPVTFIVFSSLPALDAQTRFMLGKYLGFNVTKKLPAKD